MRRSEKEITDAAEIAAVLQRAPVCRVAMCDGARPYVVPMCFGVEDRVLYFHAATEGLKLDILRANPWVCIECDLDVAVLPAEQSCGIGMRYRSVIGHGRAVFLDDPAAKRHALAAIVRHYADHVTEMPDAALLRTTVFQVELESVTGKQGGF
ncbi:MAG TPA: pyridoxamine 5'-phosphate oxidase family protein [Armatimonadota bacterium]|jgi:hypothetical protein